MALPVVIWEETIGLRKFKTYWQNEIVESAIFKGNFYRLVQTFKDEQRLKCYQLAVQMSRQHTVLITIGGDRKEGQTYTIWADKWDYLQTEPDLTMRHTSVVGQFPLYSARENDDSI